MATCFSWLLGLHAKVREFPARKVMNDEQWIIFDTDRFLLSFHKSSQLQMIKAQDYIFFSVAKKYSLIPNGFLGSPGTLPSGFIRSRP